MSVNGRKKTHHQQAAPRRHGGRVAAARLAMRIIAFEGMLASISDNFTASFISLFALVLGASKTQIGLIASLTALAGNMLQLPMAILTGRLWNRRDWVVLSGAVARGMWLVIAFLPLMVSGPPAVILFITLLSLRALAGALGVPSWTALVADIVPRRVRGIFFARRNILILLGQLMATLTAGWLIGNFGAPLGYQLTFGFAAAFGLAAAYVFSRLRDPHLPEALPKPEAQPNSEAGGKQEATPVSATSVAPAVSPTASAAPAAAPAPQPQGRNRSEKFPATWTRIRQALFQLRAQPLFLSYAGASLVWQLGVALPQPFFSVDFVDDLGGPAFMWAVVSTASIIAMMIGQRYWGPLVDRFGAYRIMIVTGLGAAAVPFLWWLAPRWQFIFAVNAFSGFVWAGYNIGSFNLLLEATPARNRATFVALYNGIIGISGVAAPFFGGLLADIIGLRPVMVISTVLRAIGWLVLRYAVHPKNDRPMRARDLLPL